MTPYEQAKFEKIVKLIISENPNVETSKELIKVLSYHANMKSVIQTSIDYIRRSVN